MAPSKQRIKLHQAELTQMIKSLVIAAKAEIKRAKAMCR